MSGRQMFVAPVPYWEKQEEEASGKKHPAAASAQQQQVTTTTCPKKRETAGAYKAAVQQLNERFRALAMLRAEAGALADRFALATPKPLTPVVVPVMRQGCAEAVSLVASVGFLDHAHVSPAVEKCEHGLRQRRSYEEVGDTPAGAIISAAGGPKPWPELSERQREIIASRKADAEAEEKFVRAAAPEIAAAQVMPGPGNVLRR